MSGLRYSASLSVSVSLRVTCPSAPPNNQAVGIGRLPKFGWADSTPTIHHPSQSTTANCSKERDVKAMRPVRRTKHEARNTNSGLFVICHSSLVTERSPATELRRLRRRSSCRSWSDRSIGLIPVSARRHRSGRRRFHPHHNDRHDRHRQRSSGGRGSIGGQQPDSGGVDADYAAALNLAEAGIIRRWLK